MSDLKDSVKSAIEAYVQSKQETHTQLDVLRMIRDQASLLFERQAICDALDADPMKQLQHVRAQVERIKSIMDVVSCTRVVTLDGYVRNDALVEWKRDEVMKDVSTNVQLTFHYERRRRTDCEQQDDNAQNSRIVYTIDVAKDFGQKERLLVIEVFALGEVPSLQPAEPLDEEEWEDEDNDENEDSMEAEAVPVETVQQEEEEEKKDDQQANSDRFAAYLDPDVLDDFLQWTQLGMDEGTTFFFLMTFPFFEHEWDLVGFVLDTVFGGGDEAMEEDEMSQEAQSQDDNSDDDGSSSDDSDL